MTKLEEIARAMKAFALADDGPTMDEADYWLTMARAAAEAMREPTPAMCKAADALEDQPWRDKGEREDGAAHWEAMIDAILNEKPE